MLRWAAGLLIFASFAGEPSRSFGQSGLVTGRVVDEHGQPVQGVHIELRCPIGTVATTTDASGAFQLAFPANARACTVDVTHPGFVAPRRTLPEDGNIGSVVLRVEPLNQSIEVRAERGSDRAPLSSVVLSRSDIPASARTTDDLIAYAKQLAASTLRRDRISVDGLPANLPPPPQMVDRIVVNEDPFSAEFADSDANEIEITTKSADRRLRFGIGGSPIQTAANAFRRGGESSRDVDFVLSGPVPKSPLVFFAGGATARQSERVPIQAAEPQAIGLVSHAAQSFSFNVAYDSPESTHWTASWHRRDTKDWNLGTGPIVLSDAGNSTSVTRDEWRGIVRISRPKYRLTGGAMVGRLQDESAANSSDLGVDIAGSLRAGGGAVLQERAREVNWIGKIGLQSQRGRRQWKAGVWFGGYKNRRLEIFNPSGAIYFETLPDYHAFKNGIATGTWFVNGGRDDQTDSFITAALYGETDLLASPLITVTAGLRADFQRRDKVAALPRLFVSTGFHGLRFRGAAGVFVSNWAADLFIRARSARGLHSPRMLVTHIGAREIGDRSALSRSYTLVSRVDPALTRPRNVMFRVSAEYQRQSGSLGIEFTGSRASHVLGSRRIPGDRLWTDILQADRKRRIRQLHLKAVRSVWRISGVLHYEWTDSIDDTDGPFSFPLRYDDMASEWSHTTNVPPHYMSATGSLTLPLELSLTALISGSSGAPSNITSGRDFGNGLFNDRAGRPRNSGKGPAFSSVSLFLQRSIAFPNLFRYNLPITADIGVVADNIAGSKNYLSFGTVMASPLYGLPVGSLPGRSFRLWFSMHVK